MKEITQHFLLALRHQAEDCNRSLPVTDFDLLALIADGLALMDNCDTDEANTAAAHMSIEFARLAEEFDAT